MGPLKSGFTYFLLNFAPHQEYEIEFRYYAQILRYKEITIIGIS